LDPLKALERQALDLLSQREHTRLELKTKLETFNGKQDTPCDPTVIEALLDRFESKGFLSDRRAAEMIVRSRAKVRGAARIISELREKGVDSDTIEATTETLKASEFERATGVWQKKFGALPQNPTEYAKQGRFLASRGFSMAVIHRLLGGRSGD
jgi:regulatory protein